MDKLVKDYKLLAEHETFYGSLVSKVKSNLEEGWVLYGTPFCSDGRIFQALVKYE